MQTLATLTGVDSPQFSASPDLFDTFNGIASGAVGVLPSASLMASCKTNVTLVSPAVTSMVNYAENT